MEGGKPFEPDAFTTGLHDQYDALEAAIAAARGVVDEVKAKIAKELIDSRKGAGISEHIETAMAVSVLAVAKGLQAVTTDAVRLGLRDGVKLRMMAKKAGIL